MKTAAKANSETNALVGPLAYERIPLGDPSISKIAQQLLLSGFWKLTRQRKRSEAHALKAMRVMLEPFGKSKLIQIIKQLNTFL